MEHSTQKKTIKDLPRVLVRRQKQGLIFAWSAMKFLKHTYFDVVRLEHMNMMINPILSTMKLYATYHTVLWFMIRNDDVRGPITYLEFEKAISLENHACCWLDVSCCSTKLTRTNTILLVFSSQPFMARTNKDGEPYILVGRLAITSILKFQKQDYVAWKRVPKLRTNGHQILQIWIFGAQLDTIMFRRNNIYG